MHALQAWLRTHRWIALALIAAGIGVRIFYELAEELPEGELARFDTLVFGLIRPHHTLILDVLAHFLSAILLYPYVLVFVLPALLLLLAYRHNLAAMLLLLVPLCTDLLVTYLKATFHRHRPLSALVHELGNSFPSGHATSAMVLYGLLAYFALHYWARRRWQRLLIYFAAFSLIIGTGLARVYLEVHYPSDVLAGWAAGACILFGTLAIVEGWEAHVVRRAASQG